MAQRIRRSTGKLMIFDSDLGVGIIVPDDGGGVILLERSSIKLGEWGSLAEDQIVEFVVSSVGSIRKAVDVTRGGRRGGTGEGGGGGSCCNHGEKGGFAGECPSLRGAPIVIEISSSSSEEDDDDDDDDDEDEEQDVGRVIGNESPCSSKVTIKTKEEKRKEDEECCILDFDPLEPPTIDLKDKLSLSNGHLSNLQDEEISIVAERGKVACRDYPHSRHLCVEYPFNKTAHESFCLQCYCYVCDSSAPCGLWKGILGHCHASGKVKFWEDLRIACRSLLEDKVKVNF